MQIGFEIAFDGREFFRGAHAFFDLLALGESFLGLLLVLPEIGGGYAGFELIEKFLLAGKVKDNSARARCARGVGRNDAGDLR
jgi:hypothetical protein